MGANKVRVLRAVLVFAALGSLIISGLNAKPWVKAAGAYDNAAIADRALGYYSGDNAKRADGKRACADAKKPGDSGGQCRAFVNCIVWMVSGGKQNIGGSYFQSFTNAGGSEVKAATDLRKGDIVQEGNGRHTSIIVGVVRDNRFMVVDSNHWSDETVGNYERVISLDSDVRAFRMGTVQETTNALPIGAIDSAIAVPNGIRVIGWALDPDTSASIPTHIFSGNGDPGSNPGVAIWANLGRSDVERIHHKGPAHGFDIVVPAADGDRQRVCAYGINTPDGVNPQTGCRDVYRPNNTPFGSLDQAVRVPGGVRVRGWAIDPDTTNQLDVHVFGGNGAPGGGPGWAIRADVPRYDVGRVYPAYGPVHGFDVVLPYGPEAQLICSYAINDRPGHNPQTGCMRV